MNEIFDNCKFCKELGNEHISIYSSEIYIISPQINVGLSLDNSGKQYILIKLCKNHASSFLYEVLYIIPKCTSNNKIFDLGIITHAINNYYIENLCKFCFNYFCKRVAFWIASSNMRLAFSCREK